VLSKRANLAFHTIAKIEAGSTPDPRIETVKKIADALGVSLDDLMK
jgi:transcriptional regulator with XRE-family HTH domain